MIVPPTGNETIAMLKTSSLVSVLAIAELLYSAQIIYAPTFQTIPLLIVASIWYLVVTTRPDDRADGDRAPTSPDGDADGRC